MEVTEDYGMNESYQVTLMSKLSSSALIIVDDVDYIILNINNKEAAYWLVVPEKKKLSRKS